MVTSEIFRTFDEAGAVGSLCVLEPTSGHAIEVLADDPVVAASVIKVLVAVEFERQVADGRIDPVTRVALTPAARTPGPVGFSLYQDEVQASLRDLEVAMLTISDNVATDALLAHLGIDACNATAAALGLTGTVIVASLHDAIDSIARAGGFADWNALTRWSDAPHSVQASEAVTRAMRSAAALRPLTATRTTPRDTCTLLREIWSDRAAPPEGCRRIRALMGRQLTRHRLASAFPPPARVAAKSGGLVGIYRHEAGVITYPDGRSYFAAVFTTAKETGVDDAAINAAVGASAAIAVRLLETAADQQYG